MKLIPLGTITDIKTGKLDVNAGAEDGKYPFFTCASTPYRINEYAFDTEAVLIAGNGDLNVKYYHGKFNAYQRTYVVQNKNKNNLSMKYLYYFIETYMNRLRRDAIGGIIKYIKLGHLTNAEIPLPPLDDQIRIAHLLGKVEGLIAERKKHLQQLDDLLKSVFLEMFGDPVRNERGWNTPTLIEVAYFENGDRSSNYPSGPDLVDNGILFLSTKNIVNNRLNLDSKVFITQEKFESLSRGKTTVGDVLITLRGTLGSCCIYDSDKYPQAFINAQMMIMRPKALIRSIYLHAFITSATIAGLLQRIGNGAAVPQLTATQLKALKIPLPPPELQEEFAAIAEKIETIKSHYQQSLSDLEALYGALSQQAFKGELDLLRVPLSMEIEK